ncbi:hypothetical protein G7Y41_04890 [Schaalia sp. ZJ405]|uniref:WD40/YVTN/BNR-like repeat-containing protein n=1 Tax=Schaalia sp. ZJ405 TaxID=2709403 RepID=UPI0013ED8FC6|nr:hypothetical protein [Schaalia sp. ZJ405]QPK80462.1 hypothetical protein G7Y41_04890 [Schaalia sp. ZJ405]
MSSSNNAPSVRPSSRVISADTPKPGVVEWSLLIVVITGMPLVVFGAPGIYRFLSFPPFTWRFAPLIELILIPVTTISLIILIYASIVRILQRGPMTRKVSRLLFATVTVLVLVPITVLIAFGGVLITAFGPLSAKSFLPIDGYYVFDEGFSDPVITRYRAHGIVFMDHSRDVDFGPSGDGARSPSSPKSSTGTPGSTQENPSTPKVSEQTNACMPDESVSSSDVRDTTTVDPDNTLIGIVEGPRAGSYAPQCLATSTDQGEHWKLTTIPSVTGTFYRFVVADANTWVLGLGTASEAAPPIHITTDRGATWHEITLPIPVTDITEGFLESASTSGHAITVTTSTPDWLATQPTDSIGFTFTSLDNGLTWK